MTSGSGLRKGLLLVAAAAFWVGLLEGSARLWIRWRGDALDRTMAFLRADARLGWAQREDWSGVFLGQRLVTNEAGLRSPPLGTAVAAARRILVLGPSSTMGWGVAEEATYSRRLEALLRARRSGASVAVVNAGEVGYSAWQGLELYRSGSLRALKADVVVVAYGANDPDLHRFFFDGPQTDAEALGPGRPATSVAVQNALRRLLLFHVGTRAALRTLDRLRCGRMDSKAAVQRVPLVDFAVQLRELLRLARADGARPILMTTPFRFPDTGEPAALGRELRRYNDAVRVLARRERVRLLDAERLLGDDPGAGLLDPVHPSQRGHARIAAGLERLVEELWGDENRSR